MTLMSRGIVILLYLVIELLPEAREFGVTTSQKLYKHQRRKTRYSHG